MNLQVRHRHEILERYTAVAVACCLFWHESKHGPGARSRRRYHRHDDDIGPYLAEHLTLIHWRDVRRR